MSRFAAFLRDYPKIAVGGARLFRVAPVIPALVVIPEFIQHIVEIQLGLFASQAAFKALEFEPLRMQVGMVKIAGLAAATVTAALYFANRASPWRRLSKATLPRLALAFVLNAATTAAVMIPQLQAPAPQLAWTVATAPLLIYFFGALFGDADMTLSRAYTRGWPKLARMTLLSAPFFLVGQMLHSFHHTLALGKPEAIVWLLMAWDAVWVGLMACWTGAALGVGYGPVDPATAAEPETAAA